MGEIDNMQGLPSIYALFAMSNITVGQMWDSLYQITHELFWDHVLQSEVFKSLALFATLLPSFHITLLKCKPLF